MSMYDDERDVAEHTEVPEWIDQDITFSQVAAINQGGCASGAYMPAVTYYQASQTMAEHGDDVLDYISDHHAGIPRIPQDTSWSGMACFYLSMAVEFWAIGIELSWEAGDFEGETE